MKARIEFLLFQGVRAGKVDTTTHGRPGEIAAKYLDISLLFPNGKLTFLDPIQGYPFCMGTTMLFP